MYYRTTTIRGIFFITLGIILFMISAGEIIFKISSALLAFYMLNYGLRLCNMPPLHTLIYQWLDRIAW